MKPERRVEILPDASAIARAAADVFVETAKRAVSSQGKFTVVLAGGSTPKALYSLLAGDAALRSQVPWDETFFFFGDERCVPPEHIDSNYRMAHEAMLGNAGVHAEHVFRMKGELRNPDPAAAEYEEGLRRFFLLEPAEGGRPPAIGIETSQFPRFDLVLLGIGPDGHTASLFPGTRALEQTTRLVAANWVGKLCAHRLTMTVPVFNNAASVMFLAHGEDKAPALKAILEGPYEPAQLPSQFVRPHSGTLAWLVDESAAAMLAGAPRSPSLG